MKMQPLRLRRWVPMGKTIQSYHPIPRGTMDQEFVSSTAPVVFAEVESTGRHAALTSMPLHEAVIARQRVEEEAGESLIIRDTWPGFAKEARVVEKRPIREEYARLVRAYGKDRVVAVYGQPHEGRLGKVMSRIHQAFVAGHKPSKIIQLGSPDGDFIELPNGGSIQADAPRPHQPALVDRIAVDSEAAAKVDSSTLSKLNADADAGEGGAKPLGGDDVPEEKPIDGALVEFLTENGWNEPQAAAVGRIVRDKGIQSLADADLTTIPGVRNAEARKSLRQHLNEYRAQKSAPARA